MKPPARMPTATAVGGASRGQFQAGNGQTFNMYVQDTPMAASRQGGYAAVQSMSFGHAHAQN